MSSSSSYSRQRHHWLKKLEVWAFIRHKFIRLETIVQISLSLAHIDCAVLFSLKNRVKRDNRKKRKWNKRSESKKRITFIKQVWTNVKAMSNVQFVKTHIDTIIIDLYGGRRKSNWHAAPVWEQKKGKIESLATSYFFDCFFCCCWLSSCLRIRIWVL